MSEIIDAYLLCGHTLTGLLPGNGMNASTVIAQIQQLQQFESCLVCNTSVKEEGWILHATKKHCDGKVKYVNQLKQYRLIGRRYCIICDINFENDNARSQHINLHFSQTAMSAFKYQTLSTLASSTLAIPPLQRTVIVKTFLHFNFHNYLLKLTLLVPSWLPGDTLKEKLRNIWEPTYIPMFLSRYKGFTADFQLYKKHFHFYETVIHDPSLDEHFDGYKQYHRTYFLQMIRTLACQRQIPERMKNMWFMLLNKKIKTDFFKKYSQFVTANDVDAVIKDVVTNKSTIICMDDLFSNESCDDQTCSCMIHLNNNVFLIHEASEPLDTPHSMGRYHQTSIGVGLFDIIDNPRPDQWQELAKEIKTFLLFHQANPVRQFVYLVLCVPGERTNTLPTLSNINETTGEEGFKVYVGSSFYKGIPPHHFEVLRSINQNEEEDPIDNPIITRGTTLAAQVRKPGKKSLYILREKVLDKSVKAFSVEAAYQLYGIFAKQDALNPHIELINKRMENIAMSVLSFDEVHNILTLVDNKIPLFYQTSEEVTNNGEINWGVLDGPVLFCNMEVLPA